MRDPAGALDVLLRPYADPDPRQVGRLIDVPPATTAGFSRAEKAAPTATAEPLDVPARELDAVLDAAEDGATPVGVCGVTGYIGSAWGARAEVAKQAPDSGAANPYRLRYPVSVAVLIPDSYGVEPKVWLPTP